jgi:hypothetical protein
MPGGACSCAPALHTNRNITFKWHKACNVSNRRATSSREFSRMSYAADLLCSATHPARDDRMTAVICALHVQDFVLFLTAFKPKVLKHPNCVCIKYPFASHLTVCSHLLSFSYARSLMQNILLSRLRWSISSLLCYYGQCPFKRSTLSSRSAYFESLHSFVTLSCSCSTSSFRKFP